MSSEMEVLHQNINTMNLIDEKKRNLGINLLVFIVILITLFTISILSVNSQTKPKEGTFWNAASSSVVIKDTYCEHIGHIPKRPLLIRKNKYKVIESKDGMVVTYSVYLEHRNLFKKFKCYHCPLWCRSEKKYKTIIYKKIE